MTQRRETHTDWYRVAAYLVILILLVMFWLGVAVAVSRAAPRPDPAPGTGRTAVVVPGRYVCTENLQWGRTPDGGLWATATPVCAYVIRHRHHGIRSAGTAVLKAAGGLDR